MAAQHRGAAARRPALQPGPARQASAAGQRTALPDRHPHSHPAASGRHTGAAHPCQAAAPRSSPCADGAGAERRFGPTAAGQLGDGLAASQSLAHLGENRGMTNQEYVQQKAAASGSSFYYAFLFLPPERRAAITAFYAFCREVDDVVDEVSDPGVAATKLAWWRQEVARAFAGQPSHPVTQGCQTDLEQSRFLDLPALERYCHLVAGVVGEVAASIFGQTDPQTTAYAHRLGLAMQLTNIIRDVGDDARRGRIYLPISELQRFDVKAHELLKREAPWGYSDRFQALMRFQAERAHATYDAALKLLPAADRVAQKPGLMMANIYRSLLREIEAQRFQVLHQRTSLTPIRKLWIALATHWRGH